MCDLCSKKKDLMSDLNSITQFIKCTGHMRSIDVSSILSLLISLCSLCLTDQYGSFGITDLLISL